MIGDTVGHYRIIERLGAGGMGEVYLAEDLKLKRKAAVKVIALDLTRDPLRRQRFIQEAMLAASVDHPHIAAVFDIDQAGDRTFIAMEYVRGETLRHSIAGGPLTVRRALDLAIQIADALAKVHEHGVVHRDLKPENVLVSEDGYAKVIDFGLAKLTEPPADAAAADGATATVAHVRTADGVVLGTMVYMSPEQARGRPVDARSDIFSFGVVLYEMLTGASPFKRPSPAETVSAILTENVQPLAIPDAAVAPELQRIVRKCLVKDPGGRYQSMRDVVVDLRDAREQAGSATRSASAAAAPTRPRATIVFASAVALLAFGLVGSFIWMRGRTRAEPAPSPRSARPSLAVLTFDSVGTGTDHSWLGKGLPSMLVTGLAQTPDIEVVATDRLNDAARQMGKESVDAVERARLTEVARRAGATFAVTGSVIGADNDLRIDARIEDLANGRVVVAVSVRGKDPLALADDLSARIRQGLDVRADPAVRRVADVTSSSTEAFRLYSVGLDAHYKFHTVEARKAFEQAIAIDPDFALAHLRLYDFAKGSRPEDGRASLARAAAHLDRLNERDALEVRAAVAADQGRVDDELRYDEELISKYPDVVSGYFDGSFAELQLHGIAREVEVLQRGVRALPAMGEMYNLLGYALLNDGRPADAIPAFETYVRLRPSETNAADSLAEGYLVAGDLGMALSTYQRARAAGFTSANNGIGIVHAIFGEYDAAIDDLSGLDNLFTAMVLSRAGRYRAGHDEAEHRRAQERERRNPTAVGALDLQEAAWEVDRGNCAAAAPFMQSAKQQFDGVLDGTAAGQRHDAHQGIIAVDLLAGACATRGGNVGEARARLEHARRNYREWIPSERWFVHALEGEIALTSGDAAAAERAFVTGEPVRYMPFNRLGQLGAFSVLANGLALRDGVARARVAQGRIDDAIAIYRRLLVKDRDSKWTAFLEPRYVLAVARLLDRQNRHDEARAEYRRFLDYWKHADSGLPEMTEARARLK